MPSDGLTYEKTGVAGTSDVLSGLLPWVNRTLAFRKGQTGDSCLDIGFYANVLDLGHGLGLAISTDGVGSKLRIAEMLHRYDTIGIDCVAMNVNDLICVGAEPIAMLDYIAVEKADPQILEQIGIGLFEGARQAGISIPGGELAQLGDMLRGVRPGSGLDLVGTCVGLIQPGRRMLLGQHIADGDAILGLASSGVHSNGLTLARHALFDKASLSIESQPAGLSRTLGDELLEPTRIYVRVALELLDRVQGLRALAHITSDGFLNLLRIPGNWEYAIEWLPPAPPIFDLIRQAGEVDLAEMFRVFNMGIGLCAVVAEPEVDEALRICSSNQIPAWRIGTARCSQSPRTRVNPVGLVGEHGAFTVHPGSGREGSPRS